MRRRSASHTAPIEDATYVGSHDDHAAAGLRAEGKGFGLVGDGFGQAGLGSDGITETQSYGLGGFEGLSRGAQEGGHVLDGGAIRPVRAETRRFRWCP